jgi:hypothetical protein
MKMKCAAPVVLAFAVVAASLLAGPVQAQPIAKNVWPGPGLVVTGQVDSGPDLRTLDEAVLLAVGAVVALTGVGSGIGAALVIGAVLGNLMMMHSCPVFVGDGTLLGEDSCVWANATGQKTTQFGSTADTLVWRGGGQKEVAPGWFLGGALGFGTSWQQTAVGPTGRGQTVDGGLVLKHVAGPWLLSGGLALAATSNHSDRPVGLPNGGTATMQSDSNVLSGGLRLRGAYDVAFDAWYLRPRLDIDLIASRFSGFQEYGPASALNIDGFGRTGVALTPTLEIGGRYTMGGATILRPYLSAGASFLPANSWTMTGSLAGNTLTAAFTGPEVTGNLEAGLQLYEVKGWEVKLDYRLSAAESFLSQSLGLRAAWHF